MIEAEKATYTIKRMCELLEVSPGRDIRKVGAEPASRGSPPSPTKARRAELDAKVAVFHKGVRWRVRCAPGSLSDLRAVVGERVSRKTVAASLRRQGLAGISPRTFAPATTVVDLDAAGA